MLAESDEQGDGADREERALEDPGGQVADGDCRGVRAEDRQHERTDRDDGYRVEQHHHPPVVRSAPGEAVVAMEVPMP